MHYSKLLHLLHVTTCETRLNQCFTFKTTDTFACINSKKRYNCKHLPCPLVGCLVPVHQSISWLLASWSTLRPLFVCLFVCTLLLLAIFVTLSLPSSSNWWKREGERMGGGCCVIGLMSLLVNTQKTCPMA